MRLIFFSLLLFFIPKISQAACSSPVGSAGQLQWIPADSKIKFCDGTNWNENNHGTLDSCSGVTAGTINFNSATSDLRYCNGANWISMKGVEITSCLGITPGTYTWDPDLSTMKYCDGTDWRDIASDDPCLGTPTPGTVCAGGAIYLGTLASNKYMTTPGGCEEIPEGQKVDTGNGNSDYPSVDFTPTCSGIDALRKYWNDGSLNYTSTGASNISLGDVNTSTLAGITSPYHAAARYCDKLVYGGYSDWYLPSKDELNIMFTNKASIPGLNETSSYWSSTERLTNYPWSQRFSSGEQNGNVEKVNALRIRCVRRY